MNRLKFLVFGLVVLGLWLWQLTLSPWASTRAVEQTASHLQSVPTAIALRLETLRSELQAAMLKLAHSPAVLNPGPRIVPPPAPNAERFNAVRAAALESLPERLRAVVVVGVVNETGFLVAQGSADPASQLEGFDVAQASASQGQGAIIDTFSGPHLFYSVPIQISSNGEVKVWGSAFMGVPLLANAQKLVDEVARELGLSALGLASSGKMLASGGSQKQLAEQVQKAGKLGQTYAVEQGFVSSFGPIKLPMMTAQDPLGGSATLEMGLRKDIPSTPFEVMAVASVRPAQQALADGQKIALLGFVALLALTVMFTLLISSGNEAADRAREELPLDAHSVPTGPQPALHGEPAASPDDFQFASSSSQTAQQDAYEPEGSALPASAANTAETPAFEPPDAPADSDPFNSLPPANPVSPPASASASFDEQPWSDSSMSPFDEHQTVAYPAYVPPPEAIGGGDPFEAASGRADGADFNPDQTRVATVPQELLKASARTQPTEATSLNPKLAPLPKMQSVAPVATNNPEEAHYQEVFRDFVETKEKCGEPADGLTYEKFAAKLRKNKDQLVAKYSCRSVRFQVYVKEGKAALKATPIKD